MMQDFERRCEEKMGTLPAVVAETKEKELRSKREAAIGPQTAASTTESERTQAAANKIKGRVELARLTVQENALNARAAELASELEALRDNHRTLKETILFEAGSQQNVHRQRHLEELVEQVRRCRCRCRCGPPCSGPRPRLVGCSFSHGSAGARPPPGRVCEMYRPASHHQRRAYGAC